MTTERFEVRREISATPSKVFALLCNPKGHVAIDSSGMLQSADGDPVRKVGDQFVVHMNREPLGDFSVTRYDVTVTITGFDQDVHLEWTVQTPGRPAPDHRYGYRLDRSGAGSAVTSYYDWSRINQEQRDRGVFPVLSEGALRATLGILARNVE